MFEIDWHTRRAEDKTSKILYWVADKKIVEFIFRHNQCVVWVFYSAYSG